MIVDTLTVLDLLRERGVRVARSRYVTSAKQAVAFAARGPIALDFPPLEDRESIQLALSMLITAMAQNRIEPKRATTLLYGLQVASANARGLRLQPSRSSIVRETVMDDSGIAIAPDEDSEAELNYQQMLAEVFDPREDEDEDDQEEDDD